MDPPVDPGGTFPPYTNVANFVTISNVEESSMDTDCSVGSSQDKSGPKRKRVSERKVCRHCNKKRKKGGSKTEKDCQCVLAETDSLFNSEPSVPLINDRKNQDKTNNSSHFNFVAPQNIGHTQINNTQTIITNSSTQDSTTSQQNPPSPQVARILYNSTDAAPFLVHVQVKQTSPNDNVSIHPVTFGRFLKRNQFNSVVNGSLKRIGRNRITVSFENYKDANSFISSPTLSDSNFKAFVPSFSVIRMGIVRGVPADWSEEEVKENISVPIGCGPIIKVRRINRKIDGSSEFKPTESVVLTFDGQVLPKRVYMCYTALVVDLYIYPTIQCFRCCKFGHVQVQCRATTPKCFKCGGGHLGVSCSVNEEDVECCLCKGSHFATSKKCLEYERQRAIKESMAKSCISYAEASKIHAPISKMSYIDALLSTSNIPPQVSGPSLNLQNDNLPNSFQTSYKKTVFKNRRTPPRLSRGYDIEAHNELTKDYNMPSSPVNGVAFNTEVKTDSDNTSIIELIISLIKCLSQSMSPSNAASLFDTIAHLTKNVHNGQTPKIQSSPVEQQKRYA